jgi:hypothetical protein
MDRLEKVNSELYCLGTKMMIQNNIINQGVTILDLVVERTGVNMKQYKGKGQMGKC